MQRSTGLYEQFAQSGVALQTRVLAFARAEPPAEVAEFFGSTRLLMLERLRHVADAPLAYVRTWLPRRCRSRPARRRPGRCPLHGVLTRRFGLRPGAGRNQIRAVAADAALADLLDAPAGTPLLMLQGRGMDQHGRPLEWFTTWHRAEQLVFDVDVSVGHESVQPRLQTPPAQPDAAPDAPDPAATFDGHDPLARAQALVAELSVELARLRGQR